MLPVSVALALASLSVPFGSHAVAQQPFDSWTTENGLPQNSIVDILQTRDGYLWLATFGGLVRFDGARFVVFDRSSDGIASQRIRALHEDHEGTLWAATEDGMLIRYRGGRFTTYTVEDGLPGGVGIRIEEDAERALWITWHEAITRFDGHQFSNYTADSFANRVRPPQLSRRSDDLWWSRDGQGLHVLTAGRVRTLAMDSRLEASEITGVNRDHRHNIWIRTRRHGVFQWTDGRIERYSSADGLPDDGPNASFWQDRDGDIWLSNEDDQVFRIKDGRSELMDRSGLLDFYEDREGSIWLGTNVGLRRLRDFAVTLYGEQDGLSLNWVYPILQDRRGAIWVGTWGRGVNRLEAGRFARVGQDDGLASAMVTCLYEDRAGRLWVGTYGPLPDGPGRLGYLENGRLVPFRESSGRLDTNVWAVLQDRGGTHWFATDAGLVALTDGRFTRYGKRDGLSSDQVLTLFEDRSGALWIGGVTGLTRFKDGVFTTYTERDGFIGQQVRAIYEDSDGVLWIGTYDSGLYRLADGRLTRFTKAEGLHDNGVFQILEDDAGFLWMGSNRGIARISRTELNAFAQGQSPPVTPLVLDVRDGLSSIETNGGRQPAGVKSVDGKLWFPTMGGVAVVDPAALHRRMSPPKVLIEEFSLAGKAVDFTAATRIPPDHSIFEIRYTVPSFVKPDQIRFRYRLAGLDNGWIDAGPRRTAAYHRIPAGSYRFMVSAASPAGSWSSDVLSFDIVVLPPFWKTWWFTTIVMVGTVGTIVMAHRRRVGRLQRQHAMQEAFWREVIDSQERERRRISNEMHDSLGQELAIIKKRARVRDDDTIGIQGLRNALGAIAALADRLTGQMTEIAYDLRPYQLDKIGLSRTIERMVAKVARECQLDLSAAVADIDDFFPPDSRIHVYRIVQEAISNIVKHSGAARASVVIVCEQRRVELRIEDHGCGFAAELDRTAGAGHGGAGLMGMHERARVLGGRLYIRSRQGHGTTIVAIFESTENVHG